MYRKLIKSCLILALLLVGSAARASAQDKISPAKKELIKEIFAITNTQKDLDTMMQALFDHFEAEEPKRIAERLSKEEGMTPEEREKLRWEITDRAARFAKRFREAIKKINMVEMIEGVLYPIYDKYFTEEELKEQVQFLKSPAGKKMMEIMPKAMTEAMVEIDKVSRPKFEELMKQLREEEGPSSPQ